MKKIIVLLIVFCSFCFIETASAQTCPKCEVDGYDYNIMNSTDISFCTNETSKTLQATYEVMVDYTGSIPEYSDGCFYSDYFYACTDGKLYHNAGMPAGQWDVTCSDTDTDGILDDGDNSGVPGDNTCKGGSVLNCDDNCRLISNVNQADIDNDGVGDVCDVIIDKVNTNMGTDGTLIPLEGVPTFSLASEKIHWVATDADAAPEPGEFWEWTLGIDHNYVSYWTFGMSEYSPETELILNDDVTGYSARWKWFSPVAYLPNDGMYWIKLIAEDMDGNRSESIHSIRVDTTDSDEDTIPDASDNCPDNHNTQQLDADADGIGDVCDSDPGCGGCGQALCEQTCDTVDRFLDNGDGTVTDCMTELVWLQNVNCYGIQNWYEAMDSSAELNSGECGLTEGSVEGDWRLPTREDFDTLFTDYEYGEPFEWPSVFTLSIDNPRLFWSSTDYEYAPPDTMAYAADMSVSRVVVSTCGEITCGIFKDSDNFYVWPVRSSN